MDMIILAAVAAFIVYRLYVTLGEKTGFQGDDTKPSNVVDLQSRTTIKPQESTLTPEDVDDIPADFVKDVETLKSLDSSFVFKDFLEKATSAFEIILQAYADGDRSTLKHLTTKDVFSEFDKALKDLESNNQSLEITLVRIESTTVKDIKIDKKNAEIQIEFVTEQVPLVKDKSGDIIDGNPNQIDQVIDTWTFKRDMKSANPMWVLCSTNE